MKTETLKIGGKGLEPVKVPVQQAETIDDLTSLAKGSVEVITRWANRGYRIECQERSGARDRLKEGREKGETTEALTPVIADLVRSYDATQKAARGGPRERKPVEIKTGKDGKVDMASFRAQLEAAGIKLTFAPSDGSALPQSNAPAAAAK